MWESHTLTHNIETLVADAAPFGSPTKHTSCCLKENYLKIRMPKTKGSALWMYASNEFKSRRWCRHLHQIQAKIVFGWEECACIIS
ncbi:hypothetical protein, partial [Salinicola salarius]|uniref:hypothetical protein n=1 Tax=Salinicola salarius TaxID=430457 RepID=UPI0026ECDA0E